jgi:hypothetical protein
VKAPVLAAAVAIVAGCGVGSASDCDAPGASVSEARDDPGGYYEIRGFVVAQGATARLCDALAESFPPSCGGASARLPDAESVRERDDVMREGDVVWTPEQVEVFGSIVDGRVVYAGCA